MKLKMCTAVKVFGKICLKAVTDTCFQHVVCNQVRDWVRHEGRSQVFVDSDIKQKCEVQNLGVSGESPILIPYEKVPESVFGLTTVIFSKRVREYIFFRSKEVGKSLMMFSLHKIIHPFQNKKYLRTY